ncbi:uncharacterized protein [Temnothorax longispinosus]|uniref:uncharacterized protein isoform X2 n=1 Tax=Temnothorax longispinosus TaxID=300112 RepID=UPI003A9A125F
MEDDQQFCLRWNNHQSTLIQNFDTLLESGTLVDCTLAAEGKTLKAHKVVLSACSPYFECLLSEHYDKHPVFILKDVKFKELKAMMDYMYRGEVNISQDQLAALLKAAESLQIKGLSESKTAGSSKTESRPQKTVSQPTAPSLDIPHASSGLTIEKNKVPRQSLTQSCVGDIPEDTASPQVSKGLSSREGSQSPTSRKRKRIRRRSLTDDSTIENQDASNSSDIPQQMGVPALGIAPVADEKVHADPTDSLGRSALMTQLTKPADEMLQLPLEKPEPNDNLIEPKSEYLDDAEEGVEDLTLDDDMNDLNDMEQDNNRAGPSHDSAQHPAGLGSWHVTGDRSNAGGVVGSVVGGPGTADEVFLAAQEGVQRDSQEKESSQEIIASSVKTERPWGEEKILKRKEKSPELRGNRSKRNRRDSTDLIDIKDEPLTSTAQNSVSFVEEPSKPSTSTAQESVSFVGEPSEPSTSTAQNSVRFVEEPSEPSTSTARESVSFVEEPSKPSTSTAQESVVFVEKPTKHFEIISLNDSQTDNDNENIGSDNEDNESSPSSWTNSKDVAKLRKKHKCPYCDAVYESRANLVYHIMTTCLCNPDSKTNKTANFKCKQCGRNYSYLKNLRYHQKHECKKTVKCPDCGKVMQGSFIPERHKMRHCVNHKSYAATRKTEKQEESPDELFIDDSSMDSIP